MKNAKISVSFTRFSDPGFQITADHIYKSMMASSYFTNPIPTLADIKIALDNYSNALSDAKAGGKVLVALKDQAREVLEQLLFQLGMFVMYVANGDETILVTSGYTLTKTPEPAYITSLGNVTVGNGVSSCQLISSVKPQKPIKSYSHELAEELPTETTVWQRFNSSTSKYVFTGLVPGKQYWIRVSAVAANAQVAYSTVATQFAQ